MSTKTAPELPLATSADQILGADDIVTEVHDVPEWGFRVTIKALTGTERDKYQAGFYSFGPNDKGGMRVVSVNNGNTMARLVGLSIVGPDKKRLFTDSQVVALGDKSAVALERLNDVAMRLSGLEAQTVEALKENLKGTSNGSSGIESPQT